MDKLLASIPKNMLAVLAITAGTLFIVLSSPPASVCDAQLEEFKKAQLSLLYKDEKYPKSKVIVSTKYQYLHERCKDTNAPGGCYELFSQMKTLLHDLGAFSKECASTAGSEKQVKAALWETMELMVRMAWGTTPPTAYHAKFGWLDTADISLYCKLKSRIELTYGEKSFSSFRDKLMLALPGAKDLPRAQVWDMSLFSENCARYP